MLDTIHGDLWDYHPDHWIVITTNIGWTTDGSNVMGRGVAKEAALLFPELPRFYGAACKHLALDLGVRQGCYLYLPGKMILFPTKELNRTKPYMSWRADSTLDCIDHSLRSLVIFTQYSEELKGEDVYLPAPGCGNGNLTLGQVMPLLEKHLQPSPTNFHLVLNNK